MIFMSLVVIFLSGLIAGREMTMVGNPATFFLGLAIGGLIIMKVGWEKS